MAIDSVQALGIFLAGVGSIATAWNAYEARKAAKIALDVANRAREDESIRRRERTRALANGLLHEFLVASQAAEHALRLLSTTIDTPGAVEFADLSRHILSIQTPMLDRVLPKIGDFDESIGASLSILHSAACRLTERWKLDAQGVADLAAGRVNTEAVAATTQMRRAVKGMFRRLRHADKELGALYHGKTDELIDE